MKVKVFYCADWDRCGSTCERQCPACKKAENMPEPSEPENSAQEDGTNVIKTLADINQGIAKLKGMDKITIYRFQAENIEDAFRLAARALESHKKETCMDRDVMWAWQTIKNVLSGEIDKFVPRN